MNEPAEHPLALFRADIRDILISRDVARPAAVQAADVIAADLLTYFREAVGWALWEKAWDSTRERAWLKNVHRCAKALEEVLGQPRTLPREVPRAARDTVLLPQHMDVYGLSSGVPWLRELQQYTERLIEKRRRPPSQRHRPNDHWLQQLEVEVALAVRESGVRLTKAEKGTLALIFERLHAEIGLPEHNPHRSVRRACDRLSKAATTPELAPKKA